MYLKCNVCGTVGLERLVWISSRGNVGDICYGNLTIAACPSCDCGQREDFDHDRMGSDPQWTTVYYGAISPNDMQRLKLLLRSCPDPQDPQCDCLIHAALRQYVGGDMSDSSGCFSWLNLEEDDGIPRFVVDQARMPGEMERWDPLTAEQLARTVLTAKEIERLRELAAYGAYKTRGEDLRGHMISDAATLAELIEFARYGLTEDIDKQFLLDCREKLATGISDLKAQRKAAKTARILSVVSAEELQRLRSLAVAGAAKMFGLELTAARGMVGDNISFTMLKWFAGTGARKKADKAFVDDIKSRDQKVSL